MRRHPPEGLARLVVRQKADLGIAFDGDGDRCILVDHTGRVVDGDHIMAICALDMQKRQTLKKKTVVATVMSNLGLEMALKKHGLKLVRTKVGDRYVLEAMLQGGYNLGGEQSGHLVFLNHSTTGDGILTALRLLAVMLREQKPLAELARCMEVYPQVLLNLKVRKSGIWGRCLRPRRPSRRRRSACKAGGASGALLRDRAPAPGHGGRGEISRNP
jgi:phosphoglucosamine mutase